MSPARYLILVGCTLLLLCGMHAGLFAYQLGAPVWGEYWLHEVRILKRFLASRQTEPRLLILGGSNAWFGISARQLEAALGKPTLNFATHGGFPLQYLFAEAEPYLQAGDTLLLIPEFEQYQVVNPYHTWFTNEVMTWTPETWAQLAWDEQVKFVRAVSWQRLVSGVLMQRYGAGTEAAARRALRSPDVVLHEWQVARERGRPRFIMYSVFNVDDHGDIVRIEGSLERNEDYHLGQGLPRSESQWELLERFAQRCQQKGVRLLMGWPPILDNPALDLRAPRVKDHLSRLTERFERMGIPVLGKPEEFVYERALFADTSYHLNDRGRTLRTQALIRHLLAQGEGRVATSAPKGSPAPSADEALPIRAR